MDLHFKLSAVIQTQTQIPVGTIHLGLKELIAEPLLQEIAVLSMTGFPEKFTKPEIKSLTEDGYGNAHGLTQDSKQSLQELIVGVPSIELILAHQEDKPNVPIQSPNGTSKPVTSKEIESSLLMEISTKLLAETNATSLNIQLLSGTSLKIVPH